MSQSNQQPNQEPTTQNNESSDGSHTHRSKIKREKVEFSINKDDDNIPVAKYAKPLNKDKKAKKKKGKAFKFFVTLGIVVASLLLIAIITLVVLLFMGKSSMLGDNENASKNIAVPSSVQKADDDYIIYDGHKYKYNKNVTTILFAGIDKETSEHREGVVGTGGQADSIFVLSLNTDTGKYTMYNVSRDSMVDVNICDTAGNFKGTERMQICLAHSYGDGGDTSNDNLKRSVSRLFFGIPVNAYMSVDLDVIPILNDAVGGVNVNVIEDLSSYDPALKKGANVTLKGEQAEIYVRSRDVSGGVEQNELRMERQKSYIDSFINQTIQLTKNDPTTPISLYNSISDYCKTDIDAAKITYLSSLFVTNGFSSDENIVKVPGQAVMGEKYAEYNVDNDKFFEEILNTYYTRVD